MIEEDFDDDFEDDFDPVPKKKSKKSKENLNEIEEFENDSEDEFDPVPEKKAKAKKSKLKVKSNDLHSLLASADQFSAMIDENTQAGQMTDTFESILNKNKMQHIKPKPKCTL